MGGGERERVREGEDYRFGKVLSLHIVPPIRVANIYIYMYMGQKTKDTLWT